MIELSATQRDVVTSLLGRMDDNEPMALDPADPGMRAAILLFLELSDKGPNRYPALHDALGRVAGGASGAAAGPRLRDRPAVVDLGRDRAGRATARTWVGMPGLPFISGAATLVVDAESHEPLAFGMATTLGEALVQVGTDPHRAHAGTGRQTVLTVSHAQRSPDEAPRFTAIKRTLASTITGFTAHVTDPVIKVHGHTEINIGLGRPTDGGYNPDCDYVYDDVIRWNQSPNLLVPFTGTAHVPYPIAGPIAAASKIYVHLSLTATSAVVNPATLAAGCTAQSNQVVAWSFPWTPAATGTTSLTYEPMPWALDTTSAFFFQFSVPVHPASKSPFLFTVCSTGTPNPPSPACRVIDNLVFKWHCLAEDTLVTLAEGTALRIAELDNTMRVRTGLGVGSLAVEATWRGSHARLLRLSTESGHSLLCTPAHPVMTPQGLIAASELRPGTHVVLEGGATTPLTHVEEEDYRGEVWNLMLGSHEDRAAGAVGGPGLFVANGIVVGDFGAQGRIYRASRRSLDFMRERLPPAYHRDYESALEDERRR